jgi:hypothetical protein
MEEQRKQEERLKNDPQWQPSFEQSTVIKVNEGINSFCLNQEGNLLVCCHKNVAGGAIQELGNMIFKQADEKNVNEIRVCSPEGKKIGEWKMDTEPQAICLGGDGTIYVGGAGKLIKLDKDGKVLLTADAPNVADLPPPPSPPEEKAEPEDKNPVEAKKAKENRIAELQKKMQEYQTEFQEAANGLDPNDAAAVEAYQAKIQEPMEKFQAVMQELQELQMTPQMRYQQALMARDRQMMITGLAVADQDLFVVCMSSKGHGFVVWRTDLDFAQPKKIVEKLAGCCGQMDVQTKNGELWIAHNGKHKVEHYDRDGKMLSSFGKTDRIAPDGFGGCCEPKNLRFAPNDELLASESGPPTCVKRFSTDGTFLGTAVVAPWKSGCVRVTTEMSADGGKIFLLNTGENAIHVFTKKPAETASAEKSNSDEPKP